MAVQGVAAVFIWSSRALAQPSKCLISLVKCVSNFSVAAVSSCGNSILNLARRFASRRGCGCYSGKTSVAPENKSWSLMQGCWETSKIKPGASSMPFEKKTSLCKEPTVQAVELWVVGIFFTMASVGCAGDWHQQVQQGSGLISS